MKTKRKIAFLFLDEIHHIFHFVTIATELSKQHHVKILTYPSTHELLYTTLDAIDNHNVVVEQLKTKAFRAFTDTLKKREFPRKLFWVKKNETYLLKEFDALVFTDYFHKYLLKKRGLKNSPKFIKLNHGTPGRQYAFNKNLNDFDFQTVLGEFHFNQLKALNLLDKDHAIVGYPKLDVINFNNKNPFFNNNKPVVLYNPHFSPPLSSWHHMGLEILDFFYHQKDYNLIFAPHINLFKDKGGATKSEISDKYFSAENIHIDLGSFKSVDMSYVINSDIYLGEVSSQVYEFITKARPCIFLNPTQVDYHNDYAFRFWKCGDVVQTIEALSTVLPLAKEHFKTYEAIQKQITLENYHTEEGVTASQLAAKAIEEFLDDSN